MRVERDSARSVGHPGPAVVPTPDLCAEVHLRAGGAPGRGRGRPGRAIPPGLRAAIRAAHRTPCSAPPTHSGRGKIVASAARRGGFINEPRPPARARRAAVVLRRSWRQAASCPHVRASRRQGRGAGRRLGIRSIPIAAGCARRRPGRVRLPRTDRTPASPASRLPARACSGRPRRTSRETVPLPLDPSVWREAILGRQVPDNQLIAAILSERSTALLYHGLAALDDETLAALGPDREALLSAAAARRHVRHFRPRVKIRAGRCRGAGRHRRRALVAGAGRRRTYAPWSVRPPAVLRASPAAWRSSSTRSLSSISPTGFSRSAARSPRRRDSSGCARSSTSSSRSRRNGAPTSAPSCVPPSTPRSRSRLVGVHAGRRPAPPASSAASGPTSFAATMRPDPPFGGAGGRGSRSRTTDGSGRRLDCVSRAPRTRDDRSSPARGDPFRPAHALRHGRPRGRGNGDCGDSSRSRHSSSALERMHIATPSLMARAGVRAQSLNEIKDDIVRRLATIQFQATLGVLDRATQRGWPDERGSGGGRRLAARHRRRPRWLRAETGALAARVVDRHPLGVRATRRIRSRTA